MRDVVPPLLPAHLRPRPVQPLVDRDQSCPVVYDLERALLVEVPDELQQHVLQALESGNPDDSLIAWLLAEDLLTSEDRPEPALPDLPWRAPPPASGLDGVWLSEDEVHCLPAPGGEESTLAACEALLAGTERGSRFVLHVSAAGELAEARTLRRLIAAAERLGRRYGRPVAVELTADAVGVGEPLARYLADHDLTVRLVGGSNATVGRLLARLGDRLTLCALLDTGDQLADLWHRAAALGVRRLHATKVVDRPFGGIAAIDAELRQYRRDLFTVADETFEALAQGRPPQPLYEPLVRVVRRHLSGRAAAFGAGGSAGYFGLLADGAVYPLLAPFVSLAGETMRNDFPAQASAADDEPAASCDACWARRLCTRSRYAVADPGPFRPEPAPDRCEFWRAEVEVGLLLYHRLEQADPNTFLGLATGREDAPFFDPYAVATREDLEIC